MHDWHHDDVDIRRGQRQAIEPFTILMLADIRFNYHNVSILVFK